MEPELLKLVLLPPSLVVLVDLGHLTLTLSGKRWARQMRHEEMPISFRPKTRDGDEMEMRYRLYLGTLYHKPAVRSQRSSRKMRSLRPGVITSLGLRI